MLKAKVAIIGSGRIGVQWAVLFASANYHVILYDVDQTSLHTVVDRCKAKLEQLQIEGLARSSCSVSTILKCIQCTSDLKVALDEVDYVQECVFENLQAKLDLFAQIDSNLAENDEKTILASSTSAILPSQLSEKLKHRAQFLVAHPINPPIYVPLVELVPAPWTRDDVIDRAYAILADIGQSPVRLLKEIPGFAVNNMQYAIFTRAWAMVSDGVISVADVDKVVSEGFGMRFAFFGPIANLHMNADGIADHQKLYGPGVSKVCENAMLPVPATLLEQKQIDYFAREMEKTIPIRKMAEWRAFREKCLSQLNIVKRKLMKEKPIN